MRILYVEDNPANLFLVQRVGRMGNHEIIHYGEGQPALDNFKDDKPDLVLMDVQLPGTLTGLDVVKALRAAGHKTPIIAVTAYAMSGDRERCLEAGCDAYLAKPLPVGELVELFKRYEVKTPAAPAATITLPAAAAPVPQPTTNGTASVVMPSEAAKPAASDAPTAATDAKPEAAAKTTWTSDETVPSRPTLELRATNSTDSKAEAAPPPMKDETPAAAPETSAVEAKPESETPTTVTASVPAAASPDAPPTSATADAQADEPAKTSPAPNGFSEQVKAENKS